MAHAVYPHDVSVVIPFSDDEEVIGTAVAAIADFLRQRSSSFEIIAVDDHSGDNSVAVLALIRARVPELVLARSDRRGCGRAAGAERARGRVVWFVEPTAARRALNSFDAAYAQVDGGTADVVETPGGTGWTVSLRDRTRETTAAAAETPPAGRLGRLGLGPALRMLRRRASRALAQQRPHWSPRGV